ncbi:MAG: branched-chain amino acid ABC transporter permease, partial [Spirochaetaceae bacterium]|nr:branched-chain amino acid ABC transporter permease [Spirochaetaceae bacterium]
MLSDFAEGVIIVVCINLIAVLGVSILTGFTRLFSFGNAAFMSIGAYTSALLTTKLGFPFMPAMCAGIAFAALTSWLLGSLTLRLKGDYFLITTLGFGECVRVLFEYVRPLTGGAQGLVGIPHHTGLFTALASLVLALVIAARLVYSRFGRCLEAVREEELAAESVGINVTGYKKFAFVVSAMFAGWAGALWAHHICFIAPVMFNLPKSAELTITVVIGGMGSLTGSVLGSLLVNLLPEIFRGLANYRMFLYGVAVVAVIILRPAGILGYREISLRGAARPLFRFAVWLKMRLPRSPAGAARMPLGDCKAQSALERHTALLCRMPSSSNLPWKADLSRSPAGKECTSSRQRLPHPTAQGIEAELAQKSASCRFLSLAFLPSAKMPQGRFAALHCPSAVHGA